MLDTRAVVPTAVEQNEFLSHRQVRHVALKVPGTALAVGRFAQCHNAGLAWTEVLDDALDAAILARCVTAFEENENPVAALDEVTLELHEFDLQQTQLGLVPLPVECLGNGGIALVPTGLGVVSTSCLALLGLFHVFLRHALAPSPTTMVQGPASR